jgi:hypothetical protein
MTNFVPTELVFIPDEVGKQISAHAQTVAMVHNAISQPCGSLESDGTLGLFREVDTFCDHNPALVGALLAQTGDSFWTTAAAYHAAQIASLKTPTRNLFVNPLIRDEIERIRRETIETHAAKLEAAQSNLRR